MFRALVWFIMGCSVSLAFADSIKCPPPPNVMRMEKGEYSNQPGVFFELQSFSAVLQPLGRRAPLCYAKATMIEKGDVFVSNDSLTHLFAQKIQQGNRDLKDVTVEMKDNEVHLSGKMKKLIWMDFSVDGPISTDGTNLLMQTKSIKAMGIPVKGLLDALGKHLQAVTGSDSPNGVIIKGDELVIQPFQIAHVKGHILSATSTAKGLSVRFGAAEPRTKEAALVHKH